MFIMTVFLKRNALVLVVIGLLLLVGACSVDTEEPQAEDDPKAKVETSAETTESEEEDEAVAEAEAKKKAEEEKAAKEKAEADKKAEDEKTAAEDEAKKAQSQDLLESAALSIIEKNMGDSMDIEFVKEVKTFALTPTDPEFTIELLEMIDGTRSLADWNLLVESMASVSNSLEDMLGEGYLLAVHNPIQSDKVILGIMDGFILYDAFDE